MKNFDKIKALAANKKIRLSDVAISAGISYQQLNRIIRTETTSLETLEKIAAALDVAPSFFLGDDGGDVIKVGDHSPGGGKNNMVNADLSEALLRAFDEIAGQRKLTEDALARLSKTQEQVGELLEILKSKIANE